MTKIIKGKKAFDKQNLIFCEKYMNHSSVVGRLGEKDWTVKLGYEPIFSSLSHHGIENEFPRNLFLADDIIPRPEI